MADIQISGLPTGAINLTDMLARDNSSDVTAKFTVGALQTFLASYFAAINGSGVNTSIKSLAGLTTAIPIDGGGSGQVTAPLAFAALGDGNSASTLWVYSNVVGAIDLVAADSNAYFDCTVSGFDISDVLGLAAFENGYNFAIKNDTNSGDITFVPNSPDTIDGNPSLVVGPQQCVVITKCASQWSTTAESNFGGGVSSVQVQQLAFNSSADSGAANAYVGAYTPVLSAPPADGTIVTLTNLLNDNSGNSTFDAGFGAVSIADNTINLLSGGEMLAGVDYNLQYNVNLSAWVLLNSSLAASGVTASQIQDQSFTYAIDTGSLNTVVVALSPTIVSNATVSASFQAAVTNTGATTIDCGFGALPLLTNSFGALTGGELIAGGTYTAIFNTALNSYILMNSSLSDITPVQVQQLVFNLAADTGSVNAYMGIYNPAITTLETGTPLTLFAIAAGNTGASTLNVNGTPVAIVNQQGSPLIGGEILTGGVYNFQYSNISGVFTLLNSSAAVAGGISATQVQQLAFNSSADGGIVDQYDLVLSPVVTSYTDDLPVYFTPANTNTSTTPTAQLNALSPFVIVKAGQTPLVAGDIVAGTPCFLMYSVTNSNWMLMNPQSASGGGVSSVQVQQLAFTSTTDTGSLNSYVGAYTPTITGFPADGTTVTLTNVNSTNTSAASFDAGFGAFPILYPSGASLSGGEILVGFDYNFQFGYNLGGWALLNSSTGFATGSEVQSQAFTSATDTGAVNAYAMALSPALAAYVDKMVVQITPLHTNTTSNPTLALNGLTAHQIFNAGGAALLPGDLVIHVPAIFQYESSSPRWYLLNPQAFSSTTVQQNATNLAGDAGAVNAYVGAYHPTISNLSPYDGVIFALKGLSATNTGSATLNVGPGAVTIKLPTFAALSGGEMVINNDYLFQYNAHEGFILLNSSLAAPTPVQIQSNTYNKGVDTGTTNAYVTTLTPAVVTLIQGFEVTLLSVQNGNNGASTLNINGTPNAIVNLNGGFLTGGEMVANQDYNFQWNATDNWFVLQNGTPIALSSQVLSGSALSLTTNTPTDITSLTVPAGIYDIGGNVFIDYSGLSTSGIGWINTVSATMPDSSIIAGDSSTSGTLYNRGLGLFTRRMTFTVPTTVYLSASAIFTTGSAMACGYLNITPAN